MNLFYRHSGVRQSPTLWIDRVNNVSRVGKEGTDLVSWYGYRTETLKENELYFKC